MSKTILETIKEKVLVGDGAMGTQLMLAGLEQGGCGEAWNLKEPQKIVEIQRRYVDAGSDCLITNTFGGCRIMLNRHGQKDNVAEINKAAVAIAREAFGEKPGFVLGDIGPFGGLMEPYGEVAEAEVADALDEQAVALVEAGADAIIVETQMSFEEMGLGIDSAKKAGAPCIIASMAYDVTTDGSTFRTMMGIDPERAAEFMEERGANIVALNCGTGMDMIRACEGVKRYRSACDLPVMTQPNAGLPVLENLVAVYKQTPEEMVKELPALLDTGVAIVGGCCGSTPDHIRAFRPMVDEFNARKGG
jgi:5-methyltetrahydrofolate--homocysteine methyltransferase